VHEWNVIFDTPEGGLAKHGQLLRIRTETPLTAKGKTVDGEKRILLTLKSPAVRDNEVEGDAPGFSRVSRHKVREEFELEVKDGAMLAKIFEGLGMRGWFTYEKYRTTYRLPGSQKWAKALLIEVDETPIGDFVELEGPPEAIDRAAQELGFARRDYIVKSYLGLYLEDRRKKGEPPSNMVFDSKKK